MSLSLAEEQGQVTRSRIRRAAMEVVAEHGFDATVEEIARVSGVSRRTIFRYYESQSALIATTVKDMLDASFESMDGVPSADDDFGGWLEGVATAIHTRTAKIIGRAFWDLHVPKFAGSDAIAEVVALQHDFRVSGVRYLVTTAWHAAGGTGDPPEDLMHAFALNFSTFATQALMIDFNQTPAQIGALTADILKVLLLRAVTAQHSVDAKTPLAPDSARS
jgi:AcrR family transcriptional regulator